jgi:hypothetical protein
MGVRLKGSVGGSVMGRSVESGARARAARRGRRRSLPLVSIPGNRRLAVSYLRTDLLDPLGVKLGRLVGEEWSHGTDHLT